MIKAPKGLTKSDMYGYIDRLSTEKIDSILKQSNQQIEDLVQEHIKELIPILQNMSTHIDGLRHYYEELSESFKWVSSRSDLYRVQNLLYYSGGTDLPKRVTKGLLQTLSIGFAHQLKRTHPLYQYEEEVEEEFYREYSNIWDTTKQQVKEVTTLQTELTQIVKAEVYPPYAWRDLQVVGLDILPLRAQIMAKEAKPPMKLETSVSIDILNK